MQHGILTQMDIRDIITYKQIKSDDLEEVRIAKAFTERSRLLRGANAAF
jgi:hypothetical protein